MVHPTAVREQAKRADELIKNMNKPPEPGKDVEKETASEVDNGPAPQPDGASEGFEGVPQQPPVGTTPSAEQPPEPTDSDPPQPDWEHKYKVLKGKYDKEGARQREEINTLKGQIGELHSLLASVQQKQAESDTAPKQQTTPAKPLVSDREVEEYGQDLLDVAYRYSQQQFQPVIDRLEAKLQEATTQLKQLGQNVDGVEKTVQKTAHQKLLDALDEKFDNWRELDTNESFNSWLRESEPFSGQPFGALLARAYEAKDPTRVGRIITAFLKDHADETTARERTPQLKAETPPTNKAVAGRKPRMQLETMVAPGTNRPQEKVGAQQEKRVWTRDDIAAFYRQVEKGQVKGDEKDRLERDIFEAQREGRFRP